MAEKINLSSKKILDKKFSPNFKGYDPDEVDRWLDLIIEDYRHFETIESEVSRLTAELAIYKNAKKEAEDAKARYTLLEGKLKVLDDNPNAALDRLELLVRLSKLESALYKAGIDPTKIV